MSFETFEAKVEAIRDEAIKKLENSAVIVMAVDQKGNWCVRWSSSPPIVLIGLAEIGKTTMVEDVLKGKVK